jgi:hypothetical protein
VPDGVGFEAVDAVTVRMKARFLPGRENREVFLNINTNIIAGASSTESRKQKGIRRSYSPPKEKRREEKRTKQDRK